MFLLPLSTILIDYRSESYSEVSDLNPFLHHHDSSFEDAYPEPGSSRSHESMEVKPLNLFNKPKGMSQSRSESHINYRPAPASIRSHYEARDEVKYQKKFGGNLRSPPLPSPVRGRSVSRTPSPTKLSPSGKVSPTKLDDIKEDQPTEVILSPTKRSRSPVKQLFGEHGWLGKSTSMKELPSEQYRKSGIKHWGGKLKQRVGEMVSTFSSPSSTPPAKARSNAANTIPLSRRKTYPKGYIRSLHRHIPVPLHPLPSRSQVLPLPNYRPKPNSRFPSRRQSKLGSSPILNS